MLGAHRLRLFLILIVLAVLAAAIAITYRRPMLDLTTRDDGLTVGQWEYLSDLPWETVSTGWVAVGNEGQPMRDGSFMGGRIRIGGYAYEKGIGTYPLSEIEFRLNGEYSAFESEVGIDDSVPAGRGGVVFQVYLDDAMAYSSESLKSGDDPVQISLSLVGIGALRLVAIDTTDGVARNYADWADARVLKRLVTFAGKTVSPELAAVRADNDLRQARRQSEKREVKATAASEVVAFNRSIGLATSGGSLSSRFDQTRKMLLLSNSKLGIQLGYGGAEHGLLTVLDLGDKRLVLNNAFASVDLSGIGSIALPFDTEPAEDGFRFDEVDDPVFGNGLRLVAEFMAKDQPTTLVVEITLFRQSRYFLYSLKLKDIVYLADPQPIFHYFASGGVNLVVDEDVEYLTDLSRLRRARAHDDGIAREEEIGQGKPLFIWSNAASRGLLLATLDETDSSPLMKFQLDPGRVTGRLSYSAISLRSSLSSPRLYVEVTDTADTRLAFIDFKRFFAALYPPLPIPSWVKYQWLSWYPYGMDISEETLRDQVDYIAAILADLGPWHIIVDAGWYIAEGRSGAEWRNVDYAKFPSGLRSFVDYAHSRGVKVVLYFSTPYLDSRVEAGDWLGLKGIIEEHRDWLIRIGESEGRESFVYDYNNPELRDYMKEVMTDYFLRYDVDGIKVDGLGNAGGALLDPSRLDAFGLTDRVVAPTMDIYRFTYDTITSLKDDIYIESGWLTPLFANTYAHTFRYGDEAAEFSSQYPFPGLVEHIDYAQVQDMVLGQRANMGALRGDANSSQINRWMLEAALALGAQTVLSFYMPGLEDWALSAYRGLLYHYHAFEGETNYGSSLYADTFATTFKGTTYLGVLNRSTDSTRFDLRLSDFGLAKGTSYTAYKVEDAAYLRVRDSIEVVLPPQSFVLYILRADPGVMWTNSAIDYSQSTSEIFMQVRGPESLPGFVQVMVPGIRGVFLDGDALERQTTDRWSVETYQYNPLTRVLTILYDHASEHEIRIELP
ncbi:MAG: NPCBM/NEW2 domain-containing protein [Dehalococcoidia bacterium]|nr:NPCBM/NEW2 domain-containing protein [Dehalococcoidia bacterium]